MEYVLTCFYAVIFFNVILHASFFKAGNIKPHYFGFIFIAKIFAGIFLGYLYQSYFNGGDTFSFFNDANKLHGLLKTHPVDFFKIIFGFNTGTTYDQFFQQLGGWNNYEYFYNDSRTIIRINALIRIVSCGYYNVHVIFFSFLALTGLTGIYKLFIEDTSGKEKYFFVAIYLLPSVLFWTSGILKEGLLLFALGLFLYSFVKLVRKDFSVKYIFTFLMTFLLLIYLKIYILVILFPGLIAFYWTMKTNSKLAFIKFILVYLTFFIVLYCLKFLNPEYDIAQIIYWKQHNSIAYAKYFKSGSLVQPPLLEPNAAVIIYKSPHAFLNTIILPGWKYVSNPFSFLASLENSFIILSIIISIVFSQKIKREHQPLFLFSLFYVVLLFILIGLTTPVLGAMVRYKVPALPFLVSISIMVVNDKKLIKIFKR